MLREPAVEEGEVVSGTRKGFKKHVFKVRIRGKQRQRCEEREEPEFSQSPCRRRDYGLAQRHPDTHPLYIYHYVVTVTELCRWFSYFYIL